MLSKKEKDIKIRKSYHKIEKLRKLKKFVFINLLNRKNLKQTRLKEYLFAFFLKKQETLPCKLKVRIHNRCVLNNRNRGVLRAFSISRVLLRNLMQFGIIPGYSKAVW